MSSPVAAPWTSVSASYAPYDLPTEHFLSLRVTITLEPVPTSSTTSSHARYTRASTLPQKQPIAPTKTCPQHTQHGDNEPKRDTPTTVATAAPLTSHSEVNITHEKKCQPQGGPELELNTDIPTLASPLSSTLAMITPAKTCQPQANTCEPQL